MALRCLFSMLLVACVAQVAFAQSAPRPMPISGGGSSGENSSLQWRNPGASVPGRPVASVQPAAFSTEPSVPPKENVSSSGTLLKVTSGLKELPNDAGQVWRDYDITPYTSRVTTTAKPEQAIIDWILRETGTDVWFGEPLGMLHASKTTLRVYHTPEMQEVVTEIVTKFVDSQAEVKKMGVRMVTVTSPNWRRLAYRMMQPVSVKTPGIEAWLMSKENAAVLLNELRQRSDFREHHAADLLVHNGQSSTISMLQPRTFVRGVRATQTFPGYELQSDQIEEGFAMEVSPLLTPDDKMIDAVLKCSVDQIEKFVTVDVDVPTAGRRQAVDIQIPQMVSWRLHERFRWPSDQVLLISCGVVARPQSGMAGTAPQIPGLAALLPERPPRADGLMFVEFKGDAKTGAGQPVTTAQPAAVDSRGRY
ncbi:hypothetical protein DTL42_22310 [Bremerella cremea]|uniref:Uncharacterized protein n=1 Tax=Bremerella cremea TaxID=1031537 RepID=A0A368KMW1_9BACT|nr:hypothetical protein [Bremerella cremea]RCS41303.1 hypothetical protein DTL42_22310 [Bremerella cremea]